MEQNGWTPDEKRIMESVQKIKRLIKAYIEQGKLKEAAEGVARYQTLMPNDTDILLFKGQIAYAKGDLQDAKASFYEGMTQSPNHFMFSYSLGLCFEREDQYLDAYNAYRNAEFLKNDQEEEKMVVAGIERLKSKLEKNKNRGMKINHKKDYYEYIIKANSEAVKITYKLNDLRISKGFLDVMTEHLRTDKGKVFEINCKDGVIARTLSDLGFDVLAVDHDQETRLKWIGIELNSKIRDNAIGTAKYLDMDMDLERAKKLSDHFQVIILLPRNERFFSKYSYEDLVAYIELLEQKAQVQFFFSLPERVSEEDGGTAESINRLEERLEGKPNVKRLDDQRIKGYKLYVFNKTEELLEKPLIPSGLDVMNANSNIFYVDTDKCCDLNGFHYKNDWQHFVEVIKEYEENPEIRYEDSVLKRYYDRFTPRNLQEQYFTEETIVENKKPISDGWGIYPWFSVRQKVKPQKNRVETRPGGSHHFGPNTDSFGREEFNRIITTYNILKENPYEPEIYVDGYMYGYILKQGNDYRFIFTEGQHRIAALSYLGYEKVKCKLVDEKIQNGVVDIDDIKKWGMVQSGTFSRNLAKLLFNKFFEKRGQKVARKAGLIE